MGASPVHIAFRGSAQQDSVRCEYRGVARAAGQRETAIRFWLDLDVDEALPSAPEAERRFMEELDKVSAAYPESAAANFITLARGGINTDYRFLSCFVDFDKQEYLLGTGPDVLTVGYDHMAEVQSYELYSLAHAAGEFGNEPLVTEGKYESTLQDAARNVEALVSGLVEGRESVLFLAPMGAHGAISIEVWQVVAQWDLQTDDDDVVHAVRYGTSEGDPEHTQTSTNLKSRITAAAAEDEFADERMENIDELDDYYEEIGAYDDIAPDDEETTTFTPAQPPETLTCANGTAVTDSSVNRALVHDCEVLLDNKDTLAGTATLDWSADSAITSWAGVTTGGTPSRVTELDLPSKSLAGSIPPELGRLFELTVLDLSSNSLTGEIPAELGWLENLVEIRLSGNALTGCIPVALEDVATNDLSSLNLLYCAPPAPQNVSAGTPGEASIPLTWDAVSNTTVYRVEYRASDAAEWTLDDDAISSATRTVDELACNTSYAFRESAYGDGETYVADWGAGAEVSATTGACS